MKAFFLFAFILLLNASFGQNNQWIKAPVNDVILSNVSSKMLNAGGNEFVELVGSNLYHLKFDAEFNFITKRIENINPSIIDFVMIDLDRDGDKDILTYINEGPTETFINNGSEFIFTPEKVILNFKIGTLTVLDYNQDGFDDLACQVGIYLNEGPFTYKLNDKIYYGLTSPIYKPYELSTIDYDEDGDEDVIFRLVRNSFTFTKNESDKLTGKSIPPLIEKTQWLMTINTATGKKLISANSDSKLYRVSYDTATASFALKKLLNLEYNNYDIAQKVDLDGDGFEEILDFRKISNIRIIKYDAINDTVSFVLTPVGGQINGATTFVSNGIKYIVCRIGSLYKVYKYDSSISNFVLIKSSNNNIISNTLLDVDGDKNVDVVSGTDIKRYLGSTDFGPKITLNLSNGGGNFRDYDNDGDLDIVQADAWYENLGNLVFSELKSRNPDPDPPYEDPQIFFTNKVLYSDLDNDGDIDIITYNIDQPVKVFQNNNNESFEEKATIVNNDLIGGTLRYVNALDFDNDGDKDILIAAVYGLVYIENLGNFNFASEIQMFGSNDNITKVEVSDINSDGYLDVLLSTGDITAGTAYGYINLYMGSDKGMSTMAKKLYQGKGYHKASFIDIDSSSWSDVVYLNDEGLNFIILNDTTNLKLGTIESPLSSNGVIQVKDLNGDGRDDVAYICNNCDSGNASLNNKFTYFINNGISETDPTCPVGSVYLRNQEQIESFGENYSGCDVIEGDLYIGSTNNAWTDIKNFEALSGIKSIKGNLTITYVNGTKDYMGLHNLDSIYGSLTINLHKMDNLTGLENLDYIGGDFKFLQGYTGGGTVEEGDDLHELQNATIMGNIEIFNSRLLNVKLKKQENYFGNIEIAGVNSLAKYINEVDFLSEAKYINGTLEISNTNITDLPNLENIEYLGGLILSSNLLTSVTLNDKIDSILGQVNVSTIENINYPSLQYVGENFYASTQNLSAPKLTYIAGHFNFTANTMNNGFLSNLEFIGGNAHISFNDNNQEGFNISEFLGDFALSRSNLSNLNILSKVKKIKGNLDIFLLPNLLTLEGVNDSLKILKNLSIRLNSQLNFCNTIFVCNHIAGGGDYYFSKNGPACSDITQIVCNDNAVSGLVFYDRNKNGIKEENEHTIPNIKIYLKNKIDTFITSNNGYYRFNAIDGLPININLKLPNEWVLTTSNINYDFIFEEGLQTNNQFHFGLYPSNDKHEVTTNIFINSFLCDRSFKPEINIKNIGTYEEDIIINLIYPDGVILDQSYTSYDTHDKINRMLTWKINHSEPWQIDKINPNFNAPSFMDLGEDFTFTVKTYTDSLGFNVLRHEKNITKKLLCSNDPNEKSVTNGSGEEGFRVERNDILTYTIQFENLGNYYAENVIVTDTISSLLNMNSFNFLSSSHESFLNIQFNKNVVQFIFSGIHLPPASLDSILSKGFVTFSLNVNSSVNFGDEIANKAYIYFDFNSAIITNTVSSTVEDLSSVDILSNNISYGIYPNPTSNYIQILSKKEDIHIGKIKFYDARGILVLVLNKEHILDVSELENGLYFIEIVDETNALLGRERLVKVNY